MSSLQIENLGRIAGTRILVVGDLILDHYINGYTERTSPEAPVPVVIFEREAYIPGGAANVARNIAAAGASVSCAGAVGDDPDGERLVSSIRESGVEGEAIIQVPGYITTRKTRVVSHGQQVVRLDREMRADLAPEEEARLINAIKAAAENAQAIVVSDYAKGILTNNVLALLADVAKSRSIPLFVDPKGRDYARYRGAFALTPNAKEAFEATGFDTGNEQGLKTAAEAIFAMSDCRVLAITRGGEGVALFRRGQPPLLLPTFAREVFDVTGAGDTFVAYLAMGYASGLIDEAAASLANVAAGIVVSRVGAAVATLADVRSALLPGRVGRKLRQPEDLEQLGSDLHAQGKKIVFTNGCFDFLHAGHVAFLQRARSLGDVLVLATNSDEIIRRLKGAGRPVIREEQRISLLGSVEAVDYVVSFSDDTPHGLIRALKPDYLVKGDNYTLDQVEGHEIVREYGGQVRLLPVVPDLFTHELLAQRNK
jgi:D-beta-D-heptose 7-phosphate kinase/D-beta-D-heptose 1-phosphate adenosyltransferase